MSQRPFWQWLLRNKEWAWMSRRPAHLLVELLIGHEVRVQCPDPVADLIQLVLVVGALDQDEPLDRDTERGGHDLALRCPTAVSAISIRTMLPHPLRRLPVPVHR